MILVSSSCFSTFISMASKYYHQGRCSAVVFATTLLVFSLLLLHPEAVGAATFIVGDSSGWNFNVGNWTNGKKFKAGDILIHDVVEVNAKEYNGCTSSSTSTAYSSGKDKVKLSKGRHYFICTIPGHCDAGLKISVNAS